MRNPSSVDYEDLGAVEEFARRMGEGMVVIKHDTRTNYNITHASRPDLSPCVRVEQRMVGVSIGNVLQSGVNHTGLVLCSTLAQARCL